MNLFPRDEKFFDLFDALASRLVETAGILDRLFREPERMAQHVAAIKELEHQADELTRTVMDRLDRSFVTPIDREDIHLLASSLDDVIDLIDGVARRAQMFRITKVNEPAHELTSIIVRAASAIQAGVRGMKNSKDVVNQARQIKVLEEEGDAVYHQAVGLLFEGKPDPLDVIRWKELYDKLEDTLDQSENVGNVLESISIKNS